MSGLSYRGTISVLTAVVLLIAAPGHSIASGAEDSARINQVLEWNQIFVETLIATNTPNSSSQRLGAIVHTAVFDALNGVLRRHRPIFVDSHAPQGASARAAVVGAAYTALSGLFQSRQASLDASYAASVAALKEPCARDRKSVV